MKEDPNLTTDEEHSPTALEALQTAIEDSRKHEDGRQILNRAQQKLEAEEHEHILDTKEARELDDKIARSEAAMKQMQVVLDLLKKNRADLGIVIQSRLASINEMRKSGVAL